MGRELRRVPLDFAHPLNKAWPGFLNPHGKRCGACDGNGVTTDGKWFEGIVYLLMMLGGREGRGQALHPWLQGVPFQPTAMPGAELTALTKGLAGRAACAFGHDAIDKWRAREKILQVAGMPKTWGECPSCKGDGMDPAARKAYEAWAPTDPPTGPGFQVWETVSEGSPISPVFATEDELVGWLTTQGYSRAAAEGFAKSGWAPSMVSSGGVLKQDIESCAEEP